VCICVCVCVCVRVEFMLEFGHLHRQRIQCDRGPWNLILYRSPCTPRERNAVVGAREKGDRPEIKGEIKGERLREREPGRESQEISVTNMNTLMRWCSRMFHPLPRCIYCIYCPPLGAKGRLNRLAANEDIY